MRMFPAKDADVPSESLDFVFYQDKK